MGVLLKIDRIIGAAEKVIMIISIIAMAGILFANVVGRLVFHHSLTWAEELATLGTVYVTFVGLSYCARVGEHIVMSAIFDALKGKTKKIAMIFISICLIAGLILLGYIGLKFDLQLKVMGKTTPSLGIPYWYIYAILPIAIWDAALQYLIIFLKNIIGWNDDETYTKVEENLNAYVADAGINLDVPQNGGVG